jgi:hypothetical protein
LLPLAKWPLLPGDSTVFVGTDVSRLAVDDEQRVAWLTSNGSGRLPPALCEQSERTWVQEDELADWVRSQGARFELGEGDAQWHAVAACGLYGYDWDHQAAAYARKTVPAQPVSLAALSPSLQHAAALASLPRVAFAQWTMLRRIA